VPMDEYRKRAGLHLHRGGYQYSCRDCTSVVSLIAVGNYCIVVDTELACDDIE